MGSPNFFTHTNYANFAIDHEDEDLDLDLDYRYIHNQCVAFVEQLPPQFFYSVKIKAGYYVGVQIYIIEEVTEDRAFDNRDHNLITSLEGYEYDLHETHLFPRNAKNLTLYTLRRARSKELNQLTKLLTKFAKLHGFGEVVGKTWTSSVRYSK